MQPVSSAALQSASQGSEIGTKVLKKANELQEQSLDLVKDLPKPAANPPGMGGVLNVQA
jgi:hypothetical protein